VHNDLVNLCGRWPAALEAPAFGGAGLPDVPVLLLEGEDDLRTPVENARRVAAQFPRSRLVVAGETGHSALGGDASGCTDAAFSAFLQGKPFSTNCPRGRRGFRPDPPPPMSLAALRPARGEPGPRGRVLTGVAVTLRDLFQDFVAAFIADPTDPDIAREGGLRSGRYRLDGRGTLTLRRLSFVPGVRLSGRIKNLGMRRGRGRIRVEAARGVPGGELAFRNGLVRGTLGGRPVRARVMPASAAPSRALAARIAKRSGSGLAGR
jgi:hypothetical protein